MKLTVDRKRWLRGDADSWLLREEDNKMCILGFVALKCGATTEIIKDHDYPDDVLIKWPKGLIKDSKRTELCDLIIKCNDNEKTSDLEKENNLKEFFKKIKIDVSFVG